MQRILSFMFLTYLTAKTIDSYAETKPMITRYFGGEPRYEAVCVIPFSDPSSPYFCAFIPASVIGELGLDFLSSSSGIFFQEVPAL